MRGVQHIAVSTTAEARMGEGLVVICGCSYVSQGPTPKRHADAEEVKRHGLTKAGDCHLVHSRT